MSGLLGANRLGLRYGQALLIVLFIILTSASVGLPQSARLTPSAGKQIETERARGANGDLSVWIEVGAQGGQAKDSVASVVYAARFDKLGRALDRTPILITAATGFLSAPRALWNSGQWLVVWQRENVAQPTSFDLQGARVAADGVVLDRQPFTIKAGLTVNGYFPPNITTDAGGNWFVSWRGLNPLADENGRTSGARISPSGLVFGQFNAPKFIGARSAKASDLSAQSAAAPQAGNLLWSQTYDGQSVFGPSIKTRAGTPAQDEELADDFDVTGTIDRVVIYGYRDFNAAPNAVVQGAWVRFYANTAGQPGALQAEQYLSNSDSRLVLNSQQPTSVDITLPTPFAATGKHFLSVQLDVQTADSYWWWQSANTGALRGSPVLRRDRATGSAWTVKNSSDAVLSVYGTLTGAPRLDSLSTPTATRSGYVVATGANFGGQQGTGRVLVDNIPAIVVRWTDTSIQFYVPETTGPGSTAVQVVSSTGGSNTLPLNVTTRTQAGRVRWRFTVAAEYTSFRNGVGPDGTVYVNDVYGRVYALTPDGGLKWVTQVALTGADGPVSVGPDQTIYVAGLVQDTNGTNAPAIIALNPDGSIKWRFIASTGQSNRGGPNVGPDGKIYAIVRPLSDTGLNVFALNPNGTLAWNYNDQIYKYGQTGGKDIVFGRTVPQLYFQYESRTFTPGVVWSFGLDGSLHWTNPAANGQTVVSPLNDSVHTEMQAFTPAGARLWVFPLFGQGPTTGPDVGVDGVHYVTQNYNTLFAVNPDGTEKWRVPTGGILYQQVVSPANNVVFSGGVITYGQPGFYVGYNTADGAEIFRIPLPTEPGFDPYGQVRPDTRPTFSPDATTAYSGADVAGSGYAADPNRRYSFFYAIDTTTNLPCSYSIAPQTQAFPANGGNGTVAISPTSANCAWTATSNVNWITISNGASGTGNGTVAYTVAANTGPDARTGSLTIAGRTFTVTQPGTPATAPQVAITYPADNAIFTLPTSVFVRANAAPAQGRTLNRVEFYAGNNLIGTDTSVPYQIAWDNPLGGNNLLTAKAFDDQGGVTTSQPINIRLDPPNGGPLPLPIPKPSLNSPQQDATFSAPTTITISATPAASQYPILRVDFYADTTLVGSDSTAPYSVDWPNVPPGRYTVSARTVANNGARANSACADITVTAQNFNINGHVMDNTGAPLGGVGVSLTNGATNTNAMTDATGNYSFNGVAGGGNYTVAAAASGLTFSPGTATFNNLSSNQTADFNVVRPNAVNGSVLINEFRLRGPNGAADEFVELYNNTSAPITVNAVDNSQGWSVVSLADEALRFTIPNGTVIPARGHYLAVNSTGYSLAGQVAGDNTFTADLPDNVGLALFSTSDPQQFTTGNSLDAVGFSSAATAQYGALAAVYREGTPLAPAATSTGQLEQYSFARKLNAGTPQDTGDNAQDFVLVSTTGTVGGAPVVLGAPAPENTTSPIQRNAQLKAALIDPQQPSTAVPNRVRDATANVCGNANCALGTLTIRRRFINKTGQPVTALRFRIIDITTLHSPNAGGAQSDLRALNSPDVTVMTSGGPLTVKGLSLEQPPAQDLGGGLNSTLVVALPNGTLAQNASVAVQFTLGVQQGGSFRFLVNVEALTGVSGAAAVTKSSQLMFKQMNKK